MTDEQRQTREVAIDFIKKTWGLNDVYDAFPPPSGLLISETRACHT
jgi:hypothetical protein